MHRVYGSSHGGVAKQIQQKMLRVTTASGNAALFKDIAADICEDESTKNYVLTYLVHSSREGCVDGIKNTHRTGSTEPPNRSHQHDSAN